MKVSGSVSFIIVYMSWLYMKVKILIEMNIISMLLPLSFWLIHYKIIKDCFVFNNIIILR